MKQLILALSLISSTAMATGTLTQIEQGEVELLLAESAGKLLYLERDCNRPIDNDKFEELAKIKAFSEGYQSIEGISWSRIEVQSQRSYEKLKVQASQGQLCEQFNREIKGNYRFLK
jgi:hypothetical protein